MCPPPPSTRASRPCLVRVALDVRRVSARRESAPLTSTSAVALTATAPHDLIPGGSFDISFAYALSEDAVVPSLRSADNIAVLAPVDVVSGGAVELIVEVFVPVVLVQWYLVLPNQNVLVQCPAAPRLCGGRAPCNRWLCACVCSCACVC